MENAAVLTAHEVAERLRITVDTVYRMCRSQKLPHFRLGRLYRFTEEQYQLIIEPPPTQAPRPRNQRQRIRQLLDAVPPGKLDAWLNELPRGS